MDAESSAQIRKLWESQNVAIRSALDASAVAEIQLQYFLGFSHACVIADIIDSLEWYWVKHLVSDVAVARAKDQSKVYTITD